MRHVRLMWLGTVLFYAVLAPLLSFAAQSAEDAPVAFIPEPVYEFETVVEGTIVTHDFVLRNRGTAPLIIEKFKSG